MKNATRTAAVKSGADWHGQCGLCGMAIFGDDIATVVVSEYNRFGAHIKCALDREEKAGRCECL